MIENIKLKSHLTILKLWWGIENSPMANSVFSRCVVIDAVTRLPINSDIKDAKFK